MHKEMRVKQLSAIGLTEGQISGKEELPECPHAQHAGLALGCNYFVRTVIYHCVGRLLKVTPTQLFFGPHVYSRDQSDWTQLGEGNLGDYRRTPNALSPVCVERQVVQDIFLWPFAIPE